jgi:hypothetical protein
MTTAASPTAPDEDAARRRRRARGLTLWAILALALSPFSLATFGAGFFLGAGLVVVSVVLQRRGYRVRGPLAAGLVAVASSLGFAGACGWLFLRTAEVTGREEARQDRVERRFDRAFEAAAEAPPPVSASSTPAGAKHRASGDDAGVDAGADSADAGRNEDAGRVAR